MGVIGACGVYDYVCDELDVTDHALAAAIGGNADYQYFVDKQQRFAVIGGVGAKALVFLGADVAGARWVYPTLRLAAGYAF